MGWELTKALKLFRKLNPLLLEWLHSSIVYYQAFSTIDQIREMSSNIIRKSCTSRFSKIGHNDSIKKKIGRR